MREPEDHGHWEGDRFVFTPPLKFVDELGRDQVMRTIDCSCLQLGEGVTRDDVVHAMLNSIIVDSGWKGRKGT